MSLLFFAVAGRSMGPDKFGLFSFAVAFAAMGSVFSDLGIGLFATREIARDRSIGRVLIADGIGLRLAASFVVALLTVGAAILLRYPHDTVQVVAVLGGYTVVNSVATYCGSLFQGVQLNALTAVARFAQAGSLVSGALLLSRSTPSPILYATLYVLAGTLAVLVSLVLMAGRSLPPGISFHRQRWLDLCRRALPFGTTTVLVSLYYWNGSVILSKISGNAAVGVLGAAQRLMVGVGLLSAAFAGAVYPVLSITFVSDRHRLPRLLAKAFRYMVAISIPIGVSCLAFAGPVIALLYGPRFAEAADILRILAWWGMLMPLNAILAIYFLAANRASVVTKQAGISLAVNLAVNVFLIPLWGSAGAAWGLVAAEVAGLGYLLVQQLKSQDRIRLVDAARSVGSVVAASAVAVAAALAGFRTHALVGIVFGLGAYVILLRLLNVVDPDDMALLRGVTLNHLV